MGISVVSVALGGTTTVCGVPTTPDAAVPGATAYDEPDGTGAMGVAAKTDVEVPP